MSCPFCMIASGSPPSLNPPNLISSGGSAYLLLSTPLVVAFLDIAPVSRGHLLLCPRAHCTKVSDLSPVASAAIGFWLPILSRAVMKAIWGGTEGSWNIIQANGAEAGQTVPHCHLHVIPRSTEANEAGSIDMTDAERKNLVLGEGPRQRLEASEGVELSKLVKSEVQIEIQRLKDAGELLDHGESGRELCLKIPESGLKL